MNVAAAAGAACYRRAAGTGDSARVGRQARCSLEMRTRGTRVAAAADAAYRCYKRMGPATARGAGAGAGVAHSMAAQVGSPLQRHWCPTRWLTPPLITTTVANGGSVGLVAVVRPQPPPSLVCHMKCGRQRVWYCGTCYTAMAKKCMEEVVGRQGAAWHIAWAGRQHAGKGSGSGAAPYAGARWAVACWHRHDVTACHGMQGMSP